MAKGLGSITECLNLLVCCRKWSPAMKDSKNCRVQSNFAGLQNRYAI